MNRSHRTLWNNTLHSFVAVPETAPARGSRSGGGPRAAALRTAPATQAHAGLHAVAAAAALACCALVQAAPSGGVVSAGSGSIASTGTSTTTVTTITQTSPKLAINWQNFNTTAGETVNFVQPGSSAVALNRVLATEGTQFLGRLNANGQVFVVNPNGVLFGKTAQVNVGGLVASTLALSDADFMAGRLRFSGFSGLNGLVSNEGQINAGSGGYVALLGGQVNNSGSISARLGSVALAAGSAVTLDFAGDGLLNVAVDQGALNALASNSGQISADGGSALLTAKAAGDLIGTVVNNTGVVQARTLQNKAGVIKLLGDFGGGTVQVNGTLDASAPNGGDGGFIETSGLKVRVDDAALITTLAASGRTGNWLIDPTDYTVAPSGGDITGAAVSARLATTDVTLQTTSGSGGHGDIFINDTITWNAPTMLALLAGRNIVVNQPITSNHSAGRVALWTGRDAPQANNTADYTVNAPINIREGLNLLVNKGSDGNGTVYQVVTRLGDFDNFNDTSLNGMWRLVTVESVSTRWGLSGPSITYTVSFSNLSYALGANIDAGPTNTWFSPATSVGYSSGDMGFLPLFQNLPEVVFAGLGHTISNLTMRRPNTDAQAGLFRLNSGTIRDLNLARATIEGNSTVGAVAGQNVGLIKSVTVDANTVVSGAKNVGGVVGINGDQPDFGPADANLYGYIDNAVMLGTVQGASAVGGIVGVNNGSVSRSFAQANVNGLTVQKTAVDGTVIYFPAQNIGGLAGISNDYASITASGSNSTVGSGGRNVGGLVGTNYSDISDSYASGVVQGGGSVGGLIGQFGGFDSSRFSFLVPGATWVGTVKNSYANAQVIGPTSSSGGLAGQMWFGRFTNTVWDRQASGFSGSVGGYISFGSGTISNDATSKTSAEMRQLSSFTSLGWDVSPNGAANTVWRIYEGQTQPLLRSLLTPLTIAAPVATRVYDGNTQRLSNPVLPNGTDFSLLFFSDVAGIDAGTYRGTAYSSQLGYDITDNRVLTITPKVLSTVNMNNPRKVYDGTTTASVEYQVDAPRDAVSVTGTANYADKNAGNNKTVTATGLALVGTGAGNYTLGTTTASTTGSISKASIRAVNDIIALNRGYNGGTAATLSTASATLDGKVGNDLVGVDRATGVFSDKNAGTNKTVSISGITLGGSDAGNYLLLTDTASTTANINKASITAITGITASNKVYDGTTAATLNTASAGIAGRFGTDVLTVATATGVFSDKNAGNNKTVNISGLTLSGADAGNYTFSGTASTLASITPRSIGIVLGVSANSKVYDGTAAATVNTGAASFGGIVIGDELNLASASGSFANKNVSNSKPVTVRALVLGGRDAGNYTTVGALVGAAFANITPKEVTVSGITAQDKTYDSTTAATLNTGGASASGQVPGDVLSVGTTAAAGSFVNKNAGTGKTVNVTGLTLGGTDAGNYTLANTTTTASITPAPISAVTGITATDKTYDATTLATLNTGAASFTGRIGNDVLTVAAAPVSGAFADKNVGTGKTVNISGLGLAGADAGNYTLASTTATTTASITPAPISAVTGITANDKTYDGTTAATLNTGGAGFSGKFGADMLTVATASGAFSDRNAGVGKAVNITGITLGGADAGNYTLGSSTATSSATIHKANAGQVVAITANSKVYDGNTTATLNTGNATVDGLVFGDVVTVASATGTFANKNAGNNKLVSISGIVFGGADAGNYNPPATSVPALAHITPKTLTVAGLLANSKPYDGTTRAGFNTGRAALGGVVPGDSVAVGLVTGNFATAALGYGKAVTVSTVPLAGTDAGNYQVLQLPTGLTANITTSALCLRERLKCLGQ